MSVLWYYGALIAGTHSTTRQFECEAYPGPKRQLPTVYGSDP